MSRTLGLLALAAVLVACALVSTPGSAPQQPVPVAAPRPAPVVAPIAEAVGAGGVSLRVQLDHELLSTTGGTLTAQLELKDLEPTPAPSQVSLVLVLDRSGSMEGQKLTQAKEAARAFVTTLEATDRLGLVHFGSDVVRFELRAMDREGKAAALALIDSIRAEGATNLSGALEAGQAMLSDAPGARRLVLASDGEPTMGLTTLEPLEQLLRAVHAHGITVTALGIGADYNGPLMTGLAEAGGGFYGYLRSAGQLGEILGQEIAQARAVNAQNVRLRLEPAPGVTVLEVAGRRVIDGVVSLPDFKAGDEARVFVRLSVGSARGEARPLLNARITWNRPHQAEQLAAEVAAQVGLTQDAVAVERSRDEVVFANAVTAQAATKMVEVAAAFDRGDRATALELFSNVRTLFGQSADALAGESVSLARTEKLLRSANGDEMKHVARDLEQKGLKNFGENNSY